MHSGHLSRLNGGVIIWLATIYWKHPLQRCLQNVGTIQIYMFPDLLVCFGENTYMYIYMISTVFISFELCYSLIFSVILVL